jgi:hypothetical protein
VLHNLGETSLSKLVHDHEQGKVDQEDCRCRLKRVADEQSFQSQQLSIMAALPEMPRPTWSKLMMTTRQKFKS